MTNSTTRKFCMSALRRQFFFNGNLVKVRYYKGNNRALILEFHNQVNGSDPNELDYFEMTASGCDLSFFEEFSESCLDGFNGNKLSEGACLKEAKKMHHNLVKWFSKKDQFERFISNHDKVLRASILSSKSVNGLFADRLSKKKLLHV
jgi:hypothetical protein